MSRRRTPPPVDPVISVDNVHAEILAARTAGELNAIAGRVARLGIARDEIGLVQLTFFRRCRELYPEQVG